MSAVNTPNHSGLYTIQVLVYYFCINNAHCKACKFRKDKPKQCQKSPQF